MRPILLSLLRHKLTSALLILQIALTCAIVCNAVFVIGQRIRLVQVPSGIAEKELVYVRLSDIGHRADDVVQTAADVAALQSIAGVQGVTISNSFPFDSNDSNIGMRTSMDQRDYLLEAGQYFGNDLVRVLGIRLIAGRDFLPSEYFNPDVLLDRIAHSTGTMVPVSTLISRATAERLWPGQNALGRVIYAPPMEMTVVGVVDPLLRVRNFGEGRDYTAITPIRMTSALGGVFVLRCAPDQRQRVLREAMARLKSLDPNRVVVGSGTVEDRRAVYFSSDLAMAGILAGVCLLLLTITALGIVGLASFWVGQRYRSIGVRRALGATRQQIVRYFQLENFLLSACGIVLGMVLAYAINLVLIVHYALPRLPSIYLPVGALVLWGLGQLAVLGPALRASTVPPVVATRSV